MMTTPEPKKSSGQAAKRQQRSASLGATADQAGEAFAIVEVDDGLTIAAVDPGMTADEAALGCHGVLIDPGPYKTYEDAYDALEALLDEREDRD